MSKFHPLQVAEVKPETRDAMVVTFAVPSDQAEAFRYSAGQHLTLKAHIDGEEVRRSYSICSAEQEQKLRVAIKRIDDGLFSSWAAEHLKPGSRIEVMEPSGHFNVPLQPELARHHVAFASGSGITPILSLIKTTLAAEPASRFTLIYGNRSSSSVIFKEELEDLKDRYMTRLNLVYILSREQQDVDLFNGRIDAEKCDQLLSRWVDASGIDVAYICGPQSMMEQVQERLLAKGLAKSQIKLELFAAAMHKGPRPQRKAVVKGDEGCQVTVIHHGLTRVFSMPKNKESVLDAALEQGIELPYSCKGGVCSTCRCKLIKGEVDMDANYSLEDYELARGFVLTCQSFPITDQLLIDLDQET
ncbi:1,2-phenylacetyl-CoA epoxidase subunit PaaE [Panacagrimonas sp.]|uniref:1,2-phenylacetyl-CoA epoxidase subunit PaaE n=1 Tax=Panacagrimonas sp. TaxID=2480088 RepID=UPI003B52F154